MEITLKQVEELIIEIDNHPLVDECRFRDGLIIWLQIRYKVYRHLIDRVVLGRLVSAKEPPVTKSVAFADRLSVLRNYWQHWHLSPFSTKQTSRAVLFNSATATYTLPNEKLRSKINGFFEDVLPPKSTLNLFNITRADHFRKVSGSGKSSNFLVLQSARQARKLRGLSVGEIDKLIDFLTDLLNEFSINDQLEILRKDLYKFEIFHLSYTTNIAAFFDLVRPSFIVVEDGNYGGGEKLSLLLAANRKGIATVEVQHGVFDVAFKYGEVLATRPMFRDHKTRYLFTFGDFWNRFADSSFEKISIGYPFLEERAKLIDSTASTKTLLFISQGEHTIQLVAIADAVAKELKGVFKIIYRLHPNEDAAGEAYSGLRMNENVELSTDGDVYEVLAKSTYVVGSYSTLLFESLLFGKTPLIHRNKFSDFYVPAELGFRFTSAQDLLIHFSTSAQGPKSHFDEFWARDWRQRVTEFNNRVALW